MTDEKLMFSNDDESGTKSKISLIAFRGHFNGLKQTQYAKVMMF
jgi:hypothetical protein